MKLGLGLLQSMAWKFAKAQGATSAAKSVSSRRLSDYLYQKTNAMALKMGSQRNIKIQRYLSIASFSILSCVIIVSVQPVENRTCCKPNPPRF